MARHMTRWEQLLSDISIRLTRLRRRFPYVVWYGEEVDVGSPGRPVEPGR